MLILKYWSNMPVTWVGGSPWNFKHEMLKYSPTSCEWGLLNSSSSCLNQGGNGYWNESWSQTKIVLFSMTSLVVGKEVEVYQNLVVLSPNRAMLGPSGEEGCSTINNHHVSIYTYNTTHAKKHHLILNIIRIRKINVYLQQVLQP